MGDLAEAATSKPIHDTLMYSGSLLTSAGLESRARTPSPTLPYSCSPSPSRLSQASPSRYGQSVPIPVPSQIDNYRRIEQNLQSPNQYPPQRPGMVRKSSSASPLHFMRAGTSPPFPVEAATAPTRRLSFGGAKPYIPSPQVGAILDCACIPGSRVLLPSPGHVRRFQRYRTAPPASPSLPAAMGTIPEKPVADISRSPGGAEPRNRSPDYGIPMAAQNCRMGSRLNSAPNLSDLQPSKQKIKKQLSDPVIPRDVFIKPSSPQQIHGLQSTRPLRSSPKLSEFMHRSPLPTILGSPTKGISPFEFPRGTSSQNLVTLLTHQGVIIPPTRNKTLPDLKNVGQYQCQQTGMGMRPVEEMKGPFGRSLSTGRLTDLLLKAAFGTQAPDDIGSTESLNAEKPMEIAAPLIGYGGNLHCGAQASVSPAPVIFTVGSPPDGMTPPQTTRTRFFSVGSSSSQSSAGSYTGRHLVVGAGGETFEAPSSLRYAFPDTGMANAEGIVMFEVPELPEETLMEHSKKQDEPMQKLRHPWRFLCSDNFGQGFRP
ncbi:unnamed protein product [Ranitomeya imitator]|uniref:Uncharacterized protein n=1 Tax=Ranitomeya imitator TaxID=111125 RepID=A0ABN9M7G6_9NEOB|nr:unnamed protein product [Ranitomeya imitator]